jgi:hypothetical protein
MGNTIYVIFVDFTGRMSMRSHIILAQQNFESQIENHFTVIVGKAECPWARALPFFITFFLQFFAAPLGAGVYCEAWF